MVVGHLAHGIVIALINRGDRTRQIADRRDDAITHSWLPGWACPGCWPASLALPMGHEDSRLLDRLQLGHAVRLALSGLVRAGRGIVLDLAEKLRIPADADDGSGPAGFDRRARLVSHHHPDTVPNRRLPLLVQIAHSGIQSDRNGDHTAVFRRPISSVHYDAPPAA